MVARRELMDQLEGDEPILANSGVIYLSNPKISIMFREEILPVE
jgi:hypothetical protein